MALLILKEKDFMKKYHTVFGSDFIMSFIALCIVVGLVYSGVNALNNQNTSFSAEFRLNGE